MSVAIQTARTVPLLVQIPPAEEESVSYTQSLNSFSQLGAKAMKNICSIAPTSVTSAETFNFTSDDLNEHLYGRKKVKAIDIERILRKRKLLDTNNILYKRSRVLSAEDNDELDDIEMTYSVMSFPNDVQLCLSSIPGHKLGVCSKELIPAGTWIGPYEGNRVPKGMLPRETMDSGFSWEIYKDGKLDHFLDGSDDNRSSWMRYIRCARNRFEQNMHVVQYGPNIYYRSFKAINIGEELLVWYESQYEQYFGIPMFIKMSSFKNKPRAMNQGMQHNVAVRPIISDTDHLREHASPAHLTKHDRLTMPSQFPPEVSQTFTSSIHYKDWGRQVSFDSISPPLSVSPVASPTDEHSSTNAEVLEEKEIGVWKCGQCQERFTQRSALRLHICPSQANNPFQCGHCSMSFADPTKLRAHVVTHNNERPFKCGFCSRTFAGATTLNNHVRTHTGQKPFTCEKCGKSFSQASQMSRHQRLAEDCQ